jgi:hypothetical protein
MNRRSTSMPRLRLEIAQAYHPEWGKPHPLQVGGFIFANRYHWTRSGGVPERGSTAVVDQANDDDMDCRSGIIGELAMGCSAIGIDGYMSGSSGVPIALFCG